MNKIKWRLDWDGIITVRSRRNWLWRLFHKKYDWWKLEAEYIPKNDYSESELKKLRKFLCYNRTLDDKDIVVVINAIRPNTFKDSIEEIKTGKYYYNATAKEDINLLKSRK